MIKMDENFSFAACETTVNKEVARVPAKIHGPKIIGRAQDALIPIAILQDLYNAYAGSVEKAVMDSDLLCDILLRLVIRIDRVGYILSCLN